MQARPPFEAPQYFDRLGRRGAMRVHLSVPAKLIGVSETQNCVLIDLSTSGARIRIARPLPVNTAGFLRIGVIEAFGIAVRVRIEEDGGINGLSFDVPLSRQEMLAAIHYARNHELVERREAFLQARAWATGGL
jgi:hypothetical protein